MARSKIQVLRGVAAELRADGQVWQITLNLVINNSGPPRGRAVMRAEPAELVNAPDGLYGLCYVFDGRPEKKNVRVDRVDIVGN